ncbi:uncharacterized protein [Ptychodera flava]|uniref:uncharacterized protein n=1 Tax=Ptychodera flava TaxID=63121 RepID=UPI00396A8B4A
MSGVEDTPTHNVFAGNHDSIDDKKEYILSEAKKFVKAYVISDIPQLQPDGRKYKCRYCEREFARNGNLKNHEVKHAEYTEPDAGRDDNEDDGVLNYTRHALMLCLLRRDHNNAIHMGDGGRIIRLYKFFYLYFKVSNCPKYAYAMLELLAQVSCLLTPRKAYQLTWNRSVNWQGKEYTNHPMDLDIEHDNKAFKTDVNSYRGEITQRMVDKVSRSLNITEAITANYNRQTQVRKPSGKHTSANTDEDVQALVQHFRVAELFEDKPGRKHRAFEKIPANILGKLDMAAFKQWMKNSLRKFSSKHYYHNV